MAQPPPPPPMGGFVAPPPPLLPGWTEHRGPQGEIYFFHAASGQSTYQRPSVPPHGYAGPPPPIPGGAAAPPPPPAAAAPDAKAKKEKPAAKDPIPGAEGWLRVTTTHGNVFYTHTATKRSEWVVPEEIKEAVQAMESEERERKASEAREKAEAEREKREREEGEKRKREEEEERRRAERKAALEKARMEQEKRLKELADLGKRKRGEQLEEEDSAQADKEQGIDADELLAGPASPKRAKMEEQNGDGDDDEDEAEWQRQMAAEMAAEAEAADDDAPASAPNRPAAPPAVAPPIYSGPPPSIPPPPPGGYRYPPPSAAAPPPPNLSIEEASLLFRRMLSSLNGSPSEVNPMAPWDRELPKFVHLPEYGILPTVRDRQDAFNAWCKDRIREKRAAKNAGGGSKPAAAAAASASPSSSAAPAAAPSTSTSSGGPLAAYRALLLSSVTSTRTRFDDFRKEHKKERAFFAYGRDDREREREFKKHLKELGERKKREAEEREEDFVGLLEETLGGAESVGAEFGVEGRGTPEERIRSAWGEVKKRGGMERDGRYDAVGSSSRRAELFGLWVTRQRRAKPKAKGDGEGEGSKEQSAEDGAGGTAKKERDAQRALREREEKVRREMGRVQHQNARALGAATHGDSVIQFQQLLLDSIRDPLVTYDEARSKLSTSDRFGQGSLSEGERSSLFGAHVEKLVSQRRRAVRELFEKHAGGKLDVDVEEACALVVDDEAWEGRAVGRWIEERATREGRDRREVLEVEYKTWDEERKEKAKSDFMEMLKENTFLDFWGRLAAERRRKLEGEEKGERKEKRDDQVKFGPGDADDEEMEQADLLQMASTIDLDEVHSVLRNDQRYRAWKHEPELRQDWIRQHLERMKVPTLTVHQQMAGAGAGASAGAAP